MHSADLDSAESVAWITVHGTSYLRVACLRETWLLTGPIRASQGTCLHKSISVREGPIFAREMQMQKITISCTGLVEGVHDGMRALLPQPRRQLGSKQAPGPDALIVRQERSGGRAIDGADAANAEVVGDGRPLDVEAAGCLNVPIHAGAHRPAVACAELQVSEWR
jgi:hypothetical protein